MRYLCFFLCVCSLSASGQFEQVPKGFVNHLLNNNMHDEALFVLKQKLQSSTGARADSINLLIGKTHYALQQLVLSNSFLQKVSTSNETLFAEAHFFSTFNSAYLRQFATAQHKLENAVFLNPTFSELKNFELAGLYLLQNDFSRFDSIGSSITQSPLFQLQYKNFANYRSRLEREKRKSPFMAGLFSAVVPGLGKVYAGRRGNGLYTFLISGLLAAQTYEAYRKDGLKSARFIVYGSLFTSFYIGNIWGSTLAVRVIKNEKQDATREQILFDMHIPVRTLFR